MVSILDMLNKAFVDEIFYLEQVQLPNGEVEQVSHTGSSSIFTHDILNNVFVLPQFKYNLMYVSKVTKALNCMVFFYLDFCVL